MTRLRIGLKGFLLLTLSLLFIAIPISASDYRLLSTDEEYRLYGDNRYQTAQTIAEEAYSTTVDCVVLTPGTSFANALPASVLAHKHNAPLLLINSTAERTKEAFDYIIQHLSQTGKIYLVGNTKLIGEDFITHLNDLGYENVTRISGNDRYETDYLIARELKVPEKTPVVLSSGKDFPDALTISSFAAANGWPLLLTDGEALTYNIRNYIKEKQPAEIYITGDEEVISKSLEDELLSLVPDTKITRFAGSNRYETGIMIASRFAPNPLNIYIASATDFPDALTGSILAAKTKSPIILVNPLSKQYPPEKVMQYLVETKRDDTQTTVTALGGPAVLPENVFTTAAELAGQVRLTSGGEPVEYSYAIKKEPFWNINRAFVEHEGVLTLEQEKALLTAIKFINEWQSIDYRTLDESTFGMQYATQRLAAEERKKIDDSKDLFTSQNYVKRVEKLTVVGVGTYYMLQDTPYTYIKIQTDTIAQNALRGGDIKESKTYVVCLYNIHGYWEVDLIQ